MSRSPLSSMAKMVAIINTAIARERAVATIPFSHFKQRICEKLVQEQSLTWCKIKKETISKGKTK